MDPFWGSRCILALLLQSENDLAVCSYSGVVSVHVPFNTYAATSSRFNIELGYWPSLGRPLRGSVLLWLSFSSCVIFCSLQSLSRFFELLLLLPSLRGTVLWAFLFSFHTVSECTLPWPAMSGVVWQCIVRCWSRLLLSLRITPIGCSSVALFRMFSRTQAASLLLVLHCSFFGLLPRSTQYILRWWSCSKRQTTTGGIKSICCPSYRLHGHQENGLRLFIRFGHRQRGLGNDGGSRLVSNFAFSCSLVAALQLCLGRSLFLSHCSNRLHYRSYSCTICNGSFFSSYCTFLRSFVFPSRNHAGFYFWLFCYVSLLCFGRSCWFFCFISCNVPVVSFSYPYSPTATHSSSQPLMSLGSANTGTSSRDFVGASMRGRLARRDTKFAKLVEHLLAHEDHTLKLESSLAKSTSNEVTLRSQESALQNDLVATRVDPTASESFVATTTSKLGKQRADNKHFLSQVSVLPSTEDSLRHQLSTLRCSTSSLGIGFTTLGIESSRQLF